jgi:hypothetical protein
LFAILLALERHLFCSVRSRRIIKTDIMAQRQIVVAVRDGSLIEAAPNDKAGSKAATSTQLDIVPLIETGLYPSHLS